MSSPDLTDLERQAVMSVLNTPNLSMGQHIEAFEKSIAAFSGRRHAIVAFCVAGIRDFGCGLILWI